jgi:hypothetical protein
MPNFLLLISFCFLAQFSIKAQDIKESEKNKWEVNEEIIIIDSNKDSIRLDLGTIIDSVYFNKFFNLSHQLPSGFYIRSQEEIKELFKEYNSMTSTIKIIPDFSSSIVLFMAKERNYKIPLDINSTLMLSAATTDLDHKKIASEKEYIEYLIEIDNRLLKYEGEVIEIKEEKISDTIFYKTERILKLSDSANLHKVNYVKLFGKVFLDIMILYCDKEDNTKLFEAFQSIKIGNQKSK